MDRPNFQPYQVIPNSKNNISGSMASSIIGLPTIIGQLTQVSYTATWTGTTPIGNLAIEVSNDYSLNQDGSVRNIGTWIPMVLSVGGITSQSIPISGNTGSGVIDIASNGLYAIRPHYTTTSGTGTLILVVNGKVA